MVSNKINDYIQVTQKYGEYPIIITFHISIQCHNTFRIRGHISPTVLDRGNKIILANWPDHKHITCNVNNDIPVKIPGHPYVIVNTSVLYNCGIEVQNNFLLESLAACHDVDSKLVMYFTMNTAFSITLTIYLIL